jgi:hypothetical protein
MPFEPGQSGNPAGRPKGTTSGRLAALSELDQLLNEPEVRAAVRDGLRAALLRDPAAFFLRFVVPLLPKQASLPMPAQEGGLPWRTLCDTNPTRTSS